MHAPHFNITGIVGARVGIVAIDKGGNDAGSRLTVVAGGTHGAVIAGPIIGHKLTPGIGVAGIIGAVIAIVAR